MMTPHPDSATQWFLIVGALFVFMALTGSVLKRLPLSASMIYLAAGYGVGSHGLGLLHLEPARHAHLLERIAEVAVLISLFTAGLKLRAPLHHTVWKPALRLASLGMAITVALVAFVGWAFLGLPFWAAVLLGAVLAPTDPVLASDVQTRDPHDGDRVRFSLTGEAGLNDGTAFPFVMLALGLAGVHNMGEWGWRWLAVDLVWATVAGLGVGTLLGIAVARLVVYLRRNHKEAVGLDDFIAIGLVALSYGGALAVHGYGFLAVFAAGLALRREERVSSGDSPRNSSETEVLPADEVKSIDSQSAQESSGQTSNPTIGDTVAQATHPDHAPAFMAQAVLEFNEGLERVAEVALVVIIGAMLSTLLITWQSVLLGVVLLVIIRPIAALTCLRGVETSKGRRRMIAWFGIRGIGSIYYISYALTHGVNNPNGVRVAELVLAIVAVSIVVHGITVTPFMNRYEKPARDQVATVS